MKKQLYLFLFILSFVISTAGFAQQGPNKGKAKCISSKGYWVIENNTKSPENSTIYFYNNDNVMVYQEKVEGIKINTNKRKTLLKLKSALEQAIIAWEDGNRQNISNVLVMTAFRK